MRRLRATCWEVVKHGIYIVSLEKHLHHTESMSAGVLPYGSRIHNPFQLLSTILVKYAG